MTPRSIVILGLSITSSWGNGHATTYRSLVRELSRRGHDILFLERDVPWYACNRDLPSPPWGRTCLYRDLEDLCRFETAVRNADLVIIGSYVPEGIAAAAWVLERAGGVTAFYDIDTPVTISRLQAGKAKYISADLIPRFDLYLSFTGGPTLERLERQYGARCARALYCSVDPELYFPEPVPVCWDLGYLGTYSPDRQPALERLLSAPAADWPSGRFVVAGPQYPPEIAWPANVQRIEHLPPDRHRCFYNAQRFTLNLTRADMVQAGWSPSVRLFEAAACGTPILSDWWEGLETLFTPGEEILVVRSPDEVTACLRQFTEEEQLEIGRRGQGRVLAAHTGAHRAMELESILEESLAARGTTAARIA